MKLKFYAIIMFCAFSGNALLAQSGLRFGLNQSIYYGLGSNEGGSGHGYYNGWNLGYFKDWKLTKDSFADNYPTLGFEFNLVKKGTIVRSELHYYEMGGPRYPGIWTEDKNIMYLGFELPFIFKYVTNIDKYSQLKLQAGTSFSSWLISEIGSPLIQDIAGLLGLEISYKDLLFNFRYSRGFLNVNENAYIHSFIFSLGYILFD